MAHIAHEGLDHDNRPHGHPIRTIATVVGFFGALAVAAEGGRQMERNGIDPFASAQRFIGGLLAKNETSGERVQPVMLADNRADVVTPQTATVATQEGTEVRVINRFEPGQPWTEGVYVRNAPQGTSYSVDSVTGRIRQCIPGMVCVLVPRTEESTINYGG